MKVVVTEPAKDELRKIYQYPKEKVSKTVAGKIKKNLFEAIAWIGTNPEIGRNEGHLTALGLNHRCLVTGNYKIIYRIEGNIVFVTDVFDSHQDPSQMKS